MKMHIFVKSLSVWEKASLFLLLSNSRFMLIFLLPLLIAVRINAATWYISNGGDDSNGFGNRERPWQTIESFSKCLNGDMVIFLEEDGTEYFRMTYDDTVTNYKSGISVLFEGRKGENWDEEYLWCDNIQDDHKVVYLKSSTKIMMAHNERNMRQTNDSSNFKYNIGVKGEDNLFGSGDEGLIRIKVDGDFLYRNWSSLNGVKESYPEYQGVFSFNQLNYINGIPVVGTTGMSADILDRDNCFSYGMLGPVGNEWHTLTFADDDQWLIGAWGLSGTGTSIAEKMASDGKILYFVVDPKTPCIKFVKKGNGQFYTTTPKKYGIPKIYEQLTYISGDVEISISNIMTNDDIYYKIDNSGFQKYTSPIRAGLLAKGEHTIYYYYDSSYIISRKVIIEPDYPSQSESHGFLLWKTEGEFEAIKRRIFSNTPEREIYRDIYSKLCQKLESSFGSGIASGQRTGSSDAFSCALVGKIKGIDTDGQIYAKYAKQYILDSVRTIDPLWMGDYTMQPNPCAEVNYRGYYDVDVVISSLFAYDILIHTYRNSDPDKGITAVEDYRIRDMLACFTHEAMMQLGEFYGYFKDKKVSGMWGAARESVGFMIALTMPSYSTELFGVSGFDGTKDTYRYAPFFDNGYTWKDIFLGNYTLDKFPNIAHGFGMYEMVTRESVQRKYNKVAYDTVPAGSFGDRIPYYAPQLMGHVIQLFMNVVRRKGYDNYDFVIKSFEHANDGVLYGVKVTADRDLEPSFFELPHIVNSCFPEVAGKIFEKINGSESLAKALGENSSHSLVLYQDDWEKIYSGKPEPVINTESYVFCAGDTVVFDASETLDYDGEIVSYSWNFGDNSWASGEKVTHNFKEKGQYNVVLIATDNEGKETSVARKAYVKDSSENVSKLLFYSPFEDGIKDVSSGKHNCIVSGVEKIDYVFGSNAAFLEGNTCYIVKDSRDLEGLMELSISVWFCPQILSSDYYNIVSKGNDCYRFRISGNGDLWYRFVNSAGKVVSSTIATKIQQEKWYHLVVVQNSSLLSFYLNGVLVHSTNFVAPLNSPNATMYIGSYNGSSENFIGHIDDLRFYSRVLSTNEILALFNSPPPQISNSPTTSVIENNVSFEWITNEAASASVAYWPVASGKAASVSKVVTASASPVTSHKFQLTGLQASTQYAYSITCTDAYGNSATYEPDDYKFTTLAVTPTNHNPTLSAVTNKTTAEGTPVSIALSATDSDNDTLSYSYTSNPAITGASINAATGAFTFTPTANTTTATSGNKTYSLSFTVSDGKGGTASQSATITVTNVNQAPVANAGPDQTAIAATKTSTVNVTLSGSGSSDPDSDGSIVSYNWSCTNDQTISAKTGVSPVFSLKPGTYKFTLTVTDNEGATATSSPITITIQAPANTQPSYVTTISTQTVAEGAPLSVTASATDTDGDTLTYSCPNLPTGATINPTTGVIAWTPSLTASALSPYTVTVVASDGYGGTASTTVTIVVTDTNQPPTITQLASQSFTEGVAKTFTLTSADPDGDTRTYSCSNLPTGATLNATTGVFSWTPGTTAAESGPYTLNFSVSDGRGGTASTQVTVTVVNSNQNPTITAVSNKTIAENATLSFTLVSTDPDGDTRTYSATNLPTGATLNATTGVFSWTPGYTAAASSPYTVTVAVSDGKGGTASTNVTIAVTDTNQSPVITQLTSQSFTEGVAKTFTLTSTDPDGDTRTYSCDNLPTGATLNATTGVFSWTPGMTAAESSPYALNFTASDGRGGTSSTQVTVVVANVNQAPTITAIGNKTVAENAALSFTLVSADLDGDTRAYSAANLPTGATLNTTTGVFSWTPGYTAAASSPYTVTFTVSDGNGGTASSQSVITVTNVNQVPTINAVANKTIAEGSLLTFTLSSADADGDTRTYSATNLPTGATLNSTTGGFAWTPGYTASSASPYTVTFTVSDGNGGTASTQVLITVTDTNQPPTVNQVANKTVAENAALTFTLSSADADGDARTYSCSNLPTGAALNTTTGVFSWTPGYTAAASSPYTLTFTVADGRGGIANTQVTVVVTDTNQSPTITQLASQTFTEAAAGTFTLVSADADGDTRTYSCSNLPTGATLNASTGVFSWTPGYTAAASSPYTLSFAVSDGRGGTASTQVTLVVNDTNQSPTLTAIANKTVAEGAALTFTLAGADADNDTLTYSCSNLPSGATLNATTGVFSWTPDYTAATYSPYTLSFTVTDSRQAIASRTALITVSNVNQPVVITALAAQTFTEGLPGTFKIQAADADNDTLAYACSNLPAGATFATTTGTLTWTPSNVASASSPYTLSFTVTDGRGSTVATQVTLNVIDTNMPPTANQVQAQAFTEGTASTFTLTGSDPDNDTLTYACANLPTGAQLNATTGKFTWTPGYTASASSPYTMNFTISDGRGGSATVAVTATVADTNQAPVFNAIAAQTFVEGTASSFTVSATDGDVDTLTYACTNLPAGAQFSSSTGVLTWTPSLTAAASSPYTLNFTVSDGWGGTASKAVSVTVSDLNQSPVFGSFTVPTFTEGVAGTFTLVSTDPDGDTRTYACSNLPAGATLNATTGVFNWTPSTSAFESGPYVLNFTASDTKGGSAAKQVTITVANANQKPVFNEITAPVFVEGTQGRFIVSAVDPDGDNITYSCTNKPAGAELAADTGQFTWTPGYTAYTGTALNLVFEASDSNGGKATKTITVVLQDTNRSPVFKTASSYSVNTGNKLRFVVIAEDPDNDIVAISCTDKPNGSAFDDATDTFAWTPSKGQDGNYTAVFSASDGKGQAVTVTINIAVGSVNQAPVLNPISFTSATEGGTATFTAKASDPDDDTVSFSLQNAPAGATINAATGQFTWTPDYNSAGAYTFSVIASDGSLSVSQSLNVTVKNTNRAPVITVTGTTEILYADGLSLKYSGSDPDNDALSFSTTGLPNGAVMNKTSSTITWTTTKDNVGIHSFVVSVSDGNITTDQPITVVVKSPDVQQTNNPPVFVQIADKTVDEGQSLSFVVSASDQDGQVVSITTGSLPVGAYFTNNTFRWDNIAAKAGTYSVTFFASDGIDSVPATVKITVVDVNYPPIVDQIDKQKAVVGVPLTVSVTASDPDGDAMAYSLKTVLDGLSISGNVITWTPTDKYVGDNKLVVSVSDGKANTDSSFYITVEKAVADETAPAVVSLTPKSDAIQVPLNPLVLITLADAGSGIDLATVNITLDGTTIYSGAAASKAEGLLYSTSASKCSCTGTPARYVFQYQASEMFDYDYQPVITVTASDLSGNKMEKYSYKFTTEMYSMCAAIPVVETAKSGSAEQAAPDVVTASDGTIWSAWDDGSKVFMAPYYDSLGRFDSQRSVNTSGKQLAPSVAVATNGYIYLAWQDNSAGNWDISLARSVDGKTFDNVQTITSSQEDQLAPSLAVDSNGTVYVAYISERKATGKDIYLATLNAGLTSISETVVCNAAGEQLAPVVTCGSGTAVVAWEDYRSGSVAIYAADNTGGWNNVRLIAGGSEPDIVKDAKNSVLYTTWVSNNDIYYAEIALPISSKAFVARNIIDDTASAVQTAPAISHVYYNNKPKVFVAWSDSRNNDGNGDNDIYFASVYKAAATNILATLDSDLTDQGDPAMAITAAGAPCMVFQNIATKQKTVQMACATVIESVLQRSLISAREGGVVGVPSTQIDDINDVSIVVQPGGLTTDAEMTIARVSNPPSDGSGLRSLFSYDFGPSSTREFRKPVKITIPYPKEIDGATVSVYWYNPQTGSYTQTGMSNIEVINVNSEISAISFDTTHFCQYSVSSEYLPAMVTEGK